MIFILVRDFCCQSEKSGISLVTLIIHLLQEKEPSIVGVGIGLSKSGSKGHVVRRLAAGFPAARSGNVFVKVNRVL